MPPSFPLIVPKSTPAEYLGLSRGAVDTGGSTIRVTAVTETRDEERRTQTTVLRYERCTGTERLDRPWHLHWFEPQQFEALATTAGLDAELVSDHPPLQLRAPNGSLTSGQRTSQAGMHGASSCAMGRPAGSWLSAR